MTILTIPGGKIKEWAGLLGRGAVELAADFAEFAALGLRIEGEDLDPPPGGTDQGRLKRGGADHGQIMFGGFFVFFVGLAIFA